MDKYLCRKDVYDVLEKAMRDRSHLTQKKVTDKNGHQRTVWVRPGEKPVQQKTKKTEEPGDKKTAKPKYEVGTSVSLDGTKGDFKIRSVDENGAYHVVSADGKKGYKVSENHITGNKVQKLFDAEDKAFDESEKDAQNKYGKMTVEQLQKEMNKYKDARKYTPEYNEAMKINDILQQKQKESQKAEPSQEDKKEVAFEKKNNASKSEEIERKNDAENNVNDAIKITDSEKKAIMKTLEDSNLQTAIEKYGNNDSSTIGNMILNNLNSSGNKELFNKIRKQEWDYKNANNKQGNTFNSDYAKEAMYQIYKEYQKTGSVNDKKTEYLNQLKEIKKNNPVEYMRFMDQANKDYKQYMDAKEKAEIVEKSPIFASFPGYSIAKKEVENWESKYPDFKENADKHMAYYKID